MFTEEKGNLEENDFQEEKKLSTGAEDSKKILKLNEPKAGGKNLKQPVIEVIQAEEPEESKNNTGIDPLLIVEPSSGKGPGDGKSNLNNKEIKNKTEQDSQENKSVPDDQSGKKNTDEEKGKDNMVGNTQEFLVGKGAIQKSNQGPQSQKIARDNQSPDNQKGDNDSSYNWDDTKTTKNLDYIPDMKKEHNDKTGCHNHDSALSGENPVSNLEKVKKSNSAATVVQGQDKIEPDAYTFERSLEEKIKEQQTSDMSKVRVQKNDELLNSQKVQLVSHGKSKSGNVGTEESLINNSPNVTKGNSDNNKKRSKVNISTSQKAGQLPLEYTGKKYDLSSIPGIEKKHACCEGCDNKHFQLWEHGKVEGYELNQGRMIESPFANSYGCDICGARIYVCWYGKEKAAMWACPNYAKHEKVGGFHVCRACVKGKKAEECNHCKMLHVQISEDESPNMCVTCLAYKDLEKEHESMIKAAFPNIEEIRKNFRKSNSGNEWYASTKELGKTQAEELEKNMKNFKETNVHWKDGQEWSLNYLIEKLNSLDFSNKDEFMKLLEEQESQVTVCPSYSYNPCIRYYPTPPSKGQTNVLCFVKGRKSNKKAYMLLLSSKEKPFPS